MEIIPTTYPTDLALSRSNLAYECWSRHNQKVGIRAGPEREACNFEFTQAGPVARAAGCRVGEAASAPSPLTPPGAVSGSVIESARRVSVS
jgi:hypothetical protein